MGIRKAGHGKFVNIVTKNLLKSMSNQWQNWYLQTKRIKFWVPALKFIKQWDAVSSNKCTRNVWGSNLADEHRAQLINYLHSTGSKLGLLINFGHHPKLEHERFILWSDPVNEHKITKIFREIPCIPWSKWMGSHRDYRKKYALINSQIKMWPRILCSKDWFECWRDI